MQRQAIKSMVPRADRVRDFVTHTDTFMPRMVWSPGCKVSPIASMMISMTALTLYLKSWYKNGCIHGRVSALWVRFRSTSLVCIEFLTVFFRLDSLGQAFTLWAPWRTQDGKTLSPCSRRFRCENSSHVHIFR